MADSELLFCRRCGTEIWMFHETAYWWPGMTANVTFRHMGEEIRECPGCQSAALDWLEMSEDGKQMVYHPDSLSSKPRVYNGEHKINRCPQCGVDWTTLLREWDWNRKPSGRVIRCTCGAVLRVERVCSLCIILV